jgi:hypothetical protein
LPKTRSTEILLDGQVSDDSIKVCVDSKYLPDGRKSLNKAEHFFLNFVQKLPVISFTGNRFNTLFHNAAGTYYLRDILIQYFTTSKCSLNYTNKIILSALKDENIMAICRALGIICKVITQLYWNEAIPVYMYRKTEAKDVQSI